MRARLADPATGHRWRVLLRTGQLFVQAAQRRRVEPSADLAGIGQRAVVVVAQQQRAKPDAAAFRRGVADDYELLVAAALELEPVR